LDLGDRATARESFQLGENQAEVSVAWVKRLSAALRPFAGGAMYLNYLTESAGDAGVRDAYGSNYARLAALKSEYDPTNFFSSNRNIEPGRS
jgi:FAD/FMN-containing dehydrogenase